MTFLNFKGYQATVTYDEGTLVIQVLHVDDFLTAECVSASEAQKVFEDLINEYIADCKELGVAPNKPYKGSFNVRITPELHKVAATFAAEANLSLNAWVSEAIEDKTKLVDYRKNVIKEKIEHAMNNENHLVYAVHPNENWRFQEDSGEKIPKNREIQEMLMAFPTAPYGGDQFN